MFNLLGETVFYITNPKQYIDLDFSVIEKGCYSISVQFENGYTTNQIIIKE